MNKREIGLDEVGYKRALNELSSLKETRRHISRSLGTANDPDGLPQLYSDLAVINQRVARIEQDLSTRYAELHEAIPIDPSTIRPLEEVPYDISFERKPGYILAKVHAGEAPPALARSIIQDIYSTVRTHGSGRVMIEASIERLGTEEEVYEIMTDLAKTLPGFRIALVNRDLEQQYKMAFAIEVGKQSGQDHRYFIAPGPAEDWLLGWD